jgi:hypothetical protein
MPALAGRPFSTEDASVLEARECEVESYLTHATARNTPTQRGWWAQPSCGVGLHTQLAIGGGQVTSAGDSIASLALVGKTALRELDDNQTGFALAYAATGAHLPGQSFRHESTALVAVASTPIDRELVLHGNLGWNRSKSEGVNSTTWAMALERSGIVERLDVGIEVYGDDRTPGAFLGIGARYAVRPERFFVDFSYARQTSGLRGSLATLGIKIGL